jgi:hypothetical protein
MAVTFIREYTDEEGSQFCARIDDIEIGVWPTGFEFIFWGDVFESPCDDEGCRKRTDKGKLCFCHYETAVRTQLENGICNGLSGWDEVESTIRKKIRKRVNHEIETPYPEPAASRFANETWVSDTTGEHLAACIKVL